MFSKGSSSSLDFPQHPHVHRKPLAVQMFEQLAAEHWASGVEATLEYSRRSYLYSRFHILAVCMHLLLPCISLIVDSLLIVATVDSWYNERHCAGELVLYSQSSLYQKCTHTIQAASPESDWLICGPWQTVRVHLVYMQAYNIWIVISENCSL